MFELENVLVEVVDGVGVVVDEEDGVVVFGGDFVYFVEVFFLEGGVVYGEDFVDDENFGFKVGGDGEGEVDVYVV